MFGSTRGLLAHPAFGSRPPRQYWAWISFLSTDLKLDLEFVDDSQKLRATVAPAYLLHWIGFGLKVLWQGWCSSPTTVIFAWLQKMMASSDFKSSITKSPCYVHPQRSQEVSTALGFHIDPPIKYPQLQFILLLLSPFISVHSSPTLSVCPSPSLFPSIPGLQSTCITYSIAPSLGDPCVTL